MKIDFGIFTDSGGRAVNEDRADVIQNGERCCIVVCDGLGGHGMGDRAAETVAGLVRELFLCTGTEEFVRTVMNSAQAALKKAQSAGGMLRNMHTTAVILLLDGERGYCLHIGDSRCYRFRDGKVLWRTRDHSIPQMLFMTGEISEEEIRTHPDRNKLLRALGEDSEQVKYECSEFDVRAGDAFLLCSDGFWEPVTEGEMESLLQGSADAKSWLDGMAKLAVENSLGRQMDNFTAAAAIINS